jgi:4-aminobutyrate aminotransferase
VETESCLRREKNHVPPSRLLFSDYVPVYHLEISADNQGGTLAGNAVSCAASLATLQHLTPDLYSNVSARSNQLLNALKQLASVGSPVHHLIVDVRGLGLMVGIEFRSGDDPLTLSDSDSERDEMGDGSVQVKVPKGIGKRVREKCWERGLMVLTTSCFDSIR